MLPTKLIDDRLAVLDFGVFQRLSDLLMEASDSA
jgi:hypothetical protein